MILNIVSAPQPQPQSQARVSTKPGDELRVSGGKTKQSKKGGGGNRTTTKYNNSQHKKKERHENCVVNVTKADVKRLNETNTGVQTPQTTPPSHAQPPVPAKGNAETQKQHIPADKSTASRTHEKAENPSSRNQSFSELGLCKHLVGHIQRKREDGGLGLVSPTNVQQQAIPAILSGRDVLVKSETGSGKTLTFVLPIVHKLSQLNPRATRGDGIYSIILSPTRELSFQITKVVEDVLARFFWIISGALVGGEKRKSEKARLRKGLNILIATPGRFIDHLEKTESLRLAIGRGKLQFIVLDEADRLTDSGFEKQVNRAFELIDELVTTPSTSKSYQTILISATLNKGVSAIINSNMKDPLRIEVKDEKIDSSENYAALTTSENIQNEFSMPKQLVQQYLLVDRKLRLVALASFILRQTMRSSHTSKLIVFVSCRALVEFLHSILSQIAWPPKQMLQKLKAQESTEPGKQFKGLGTKWWKLHGNVEQKERRRTVGEFSKAKGGVLICTDVAARGLDLPNIDWIIQYDPPSEVEEYVHRVGRTARNGRKGSAVIFISPEEVQYLDVLKLHSIQIKPINVSSILQSLIPTQQRTIIRKTSNGIAARALFNADAAGDLLQIKLEDLVHAATSEEKESKVGMKRKGTKTSSSKAEEYGGPDLKPMAEDAYVSFLRAYAVHSKETKHIFHPKKLHLGHVARSFGLREPPTGITKGSNHRRFEKKKLNKARQNQRDFAKKAKLSHQVSEFK